MAGQTNYNEMFKGKPFETVAPFDQTRPFVFNSPHSGRIYPDEFTQSSRLEKDHIRLSEDFFVDRLFANVPQKGVPLLKANFPRAWLDVNREPYELDPKMFDGPLPSYANISSIRVAGGLGTVPKIVAENREIYRHRLPVQEGLERIEKVYRPYHETLRKLIARTHAKFGYAVLVDCHSMPSNMNNVSGKYRPDFIIGDRYGVSARSSLTQIALLILSNMGYQVTSNKPYAGGFITEHYGRPTKNLHALQIEINRGLYVDEKSFELRPGFDKLVEDLTLFSKRFMHYVEQEMSEFAVAAQ